MSYSDKLEEFGYNPNNIYFKFYFQVCEWTQTSEMPKEQAHIQPEMDYKIVIKMIRAVTNRKQVIENAGPVLINATGGKGNNGRPERIYDN